MSNYLAFLGLSKRQECLGALFVCETSNPRLVTPRRASLLPDPEPSYFFGLEPCGDRCLLPALERKGWSSAGAGGTGASVPCRGLGAPEPMCVVGLVCGGVLMVGIVGKGLGRHLAVSAQLLEREGRLDSRRSRRRRRCFHFLPGSRGRRLALAWPGGRPPGEVGEGGLVGGAGSLGPRRPGAHQLPTGLAQESGSRL